MSTGTSGNDTLYGTPTNDVLHGLGGDDILYGKNGEDILKGGIGADTLKGGNDSDKLYGEIGNDLLYGQDGNDELRGGNGADTLKGGNDSDKLYGETGNDLLYGQDGNDELRGSDGADTLKGGNDSDKLYGETGNDFLYGQQGNDELYGSDGDDTLKGGNDSDELYGETGNDFLYGQYGNDELHGGDGADTLKGGNDSDKLYGETGNDILYGQKGNDELRGGNGADTLKGGNDSDKLYGEIGNDLLYGERGNDILDGGNGSNTLIGVNVNAAQPGKNERDTLYGGNDDDLFILGDVDKVYYDDKLNDDYALVVDFDSAQGDLIQLHGNANDYTLKENVSGLPAGTAIILKTDGEDEVIGVVDNVINMDLSNTKEFSYKNDDPDPPKSNNGNIEVDFQVDSKWYKGFTGQIILTNKGQELIEGWTLAFDSPFTITSLWNAIQDSENDGNYQISNESWNAQIFPNSSINFGFNGTRSTETVSPPTNYKFNGEFLDSFPGLSVNDVSLTEGQEGSNDILFTVTLSAVSDEIVTVDYTTEDDTATAGVDYTATNGTLTFAPGETIKTVEVAVNGDRLYESNEKFSLKLSNASNANLEDFQGIGTIIDDDVAPPGLTINNVSVTEGNEGATSAQLIVTLDAVSDQTITVDYSTEDVSATAGQDYVAKSETLTIPPGETTKTIDFVINGDTVKESNETFKVNLSNANNVQIIDNQGVVTILNDEDNPGGGNTDYVVGAYYPEWGIYGRDFQVEDIPAENLTHIFYAFAKINENGEVEPFDSWAATKATFGNKYTSGESQAGKAGNFAELQALKQEYPHLTNMISIGGWTLSGPFSDVALNEKSREIFANSAVDFMVEYGFDGIDIDWEYPVSGGLPDNIYRPEDTQNYTLLLGELREQLDAQGNIDGQEYQLTVASPAGLYHLDNYDLAGMSQHLDFFNVMAYDYHGAWESTTNHQAALYGKPNDTSNVDSTVQKYLDAGVPAEDIVMGAPLYGRSWQGVGNTNSGLFQPATGPGPGTWPGEDSLLDYHDLYDKVKDPNSGYVRYWDGDAKVPYVYNESQGVFSTYEDIESLTHKLNYIDEKSLGGMFFWEASADLPSSHADYQTNSLIGLAASELDIVQFKV